MIENVNASKKPSNSIAEDIKKYIGVASVNVVSINPNNEALRKFGWHIPDDAEEPEYVKLDKNGKVFTRVRFLVQIQDLPEKPVIYMDYICRPEVAVSQDGQKCKIIDGYGRTAWATKADIQAKKVPQYTNGPANISTPYKPCHPGEEEIVSFIMKYLNVTPLQMYDKVRGWVPSKNPGRLTIDNWKAICDGNMNELAEYVSLQPENCVKVVLGVQTTDENKAYQTFLNGCYIGNGAKPDVNTGEYVRARAKIDDFFKNRENAPYTFSASPVKEWTVTATEVLDNSDNNPEPQVDDMPWDIA